MRLAKWNTISWRCFDAHYLGDRVRGGRDDGVTAADVLLRDGAQYRYRG